MNQVTASRKKCRVYFCDEQDHSLQQEKKQQVFNVNVTNALITAYYVKNDVYAELNFPNQLSASHVSHTATRVAVKDLQVLNRLVPSSQSDTFFVNSDGSLCTTKLFERTAFVVITGKKSKVGLKLEICEGEELYKVTRNSCQRTSNDNLISLRKIKTKSPLQ